MEDEEKCHFTATDLRAIIIRFALSWFRKNLAKRKHFALYRQLQNIANEGLGYGNDDIMSVSEKNLINRLSAVLPENPIVFDVGANKGDYLRNWLRLTDRIHAFEPGKEAFEKLAADYKGKAILNHLALSSIEGNVDFFVESSVTRLNSLVHRSHAQHLWTRAGQVKCTTLDAYCSANDISTIDFLKLDTEGYEMEVLIGARQMLNQINYIQFEFGGAQIENKNYFKDFYELLSPTFKLYHLMQDGHVAIESYHEKLENFTGANFFAIRGR